AAAVAVEELLQVAEGEATVAAGRAIYPQAAGVGPAPQRRFVYAQDLAGPAQGYPAGTVRRPLAVGRRRLRHSASLAGTCHHQVGESYARQITLSNTVRVPGGLAVPAIFPRSALNGQCRTRSRPGRRVKAEGDCGTLPTSGRLRQPRGRPEVAQPPERRVLLDHEVVDRS